MVIDFASNSSCSKHPLGIPNCLKKEMPTVALGSESNLSAFQCLSHLSVSKPPLFPAPWRKFLTKRNTQKQTSAWFFSFFPLSFYSAQDVSTASSSLSSAAHSFFGILAANPEARALVVDETVDQGGFPHLQKVLTGSCLEHFAVRGKLIQALSYGESGFFHSFIQFT